MDARVNSGAVFPDLCERVAEPSPGRYLDALLTDMDRHIRPELDGDRARHLYEALRRVLVRFGSELEAAPPLGETGPSSPAVEGASLQDRLIAEGACLDAHIAREDARLRRLDEAPPARAVSPEEVQAALQASGWPKARVEELTLVVGGRSKETLMLRASDMDDLPERLVIRRDLQVGSLGTTVADEFELLKALHEHGAPVPQPYHLSRSGDGLGTPFLLLQVMPGRVRGDMITAPASREAVLDVARALAAVHALPVDTMRPLEAHLSQPPSSERLAGEVAEFARLWDEGVRRPCAAMDAAFVWLRRQALEVEQRHSFVHGDFSFHNILFDGDRLGAVLDWELAHIGHAAEDLGYVRDAVTRVVAWDAFMDAYAQAGGRPVDPASLHFYSLLGAIRLITKMLKARELIEQGRTDDILKADVVAYWLPRLIQRVSREMREVTAAG